MSDDSQYLEDLEVPRDITLAELKDILLDIQTLEHFAKNIQSQEFIRIREKQSNGFFGRIFREGSKTLK